MALFQVLPQRVAPSATLLAALIAGCKFEPDISPLVIPTAPPPAFGGPLPDHSEVVESPEAALDRLLDELLDPFNMPLGKTYEGSVHQTADRILAAAYAYYGYDLKKLAASRQDNPLTLGMFRDYLEQRGVRWITDPATGEEFDVYAWVAADRGIEGAGPLHYRVLLLIPGIDAESLMNYERNYLAALYAAHPYQVDEARWKTYDFLRELYGDDAAAKYEYLLSLDQMGTD